RLVTRHRVEMGEDGERRDLIGHVGRSAIVALGARDIGRLAGRDEEIEGSAAERTYARTLGVGRIGASGLNRLIELGEARADLVRDRSPQGLARLAHGIGIDIAGKLARDVRLAWKLEELGAIGRGERRVAGGLPERLGKADRLLARDARAVSSF